MTNKQQVPCAKTQPSTANGGCDPRNSYGPLRGSAWIAITEARWWIEKAQTRQANGQPDSSAEALTHAREWIARAQSAHDREATKVFWKAQTSLIDDYDA